MSEKNIDINELNAPADIRLGALYNPEPTQREPELKYNATVPYYIGRSVNNIFPSIMSALTEPFTGDGMNIFTEDANNARMGIAPNTLLSEMKDIGNWSRHIQTQQELYSSFSSPSWAAFDEHLRIENMLNGGTTSGAIGRSVDQTAQKRLVAGYYLNPYFKINPNQQLIENQDGFEQKYNEYVNSVKLTNDDRFLKEMNATDSKLANTNVKDAKLPELKLLSQKELHEAFDNFNGTGALGRYVANLSAEDGWLTIGWAAKDILTGFGSSNALDTVGGGFELATYQNPWNIMETPVVSLGKDLVDHVAKEDPNFNGPEWFSQLELPVEVRHQMLLNGIDTSSFVGSRGKNEALFTLQNLMFTTTLRDKYEDFLKKNEFWNSKTGSIVKIGVSLPNMIASDQDTVLAVGTTLLSAGVSVVLKGTAFGLSAMKFTVAAANTMKATGVVLEGLGTATALSTGGIPRFLKYANWGTKLGYSVGTGSLIMVARNFKDQENKIAFTVAGLEEQGKYSYDLSEAATAAFDGAIFGGVMHGVHVGAGYLNKKIRIELNGGIDYNGYTINGPNTKMRPAVTDLYFGEKFNEAQLLDRSAGKYPPYYLPSSVVRKEERRQYDQVALGLTPERQLHLDSLTETLIAESNSKVPEPTPLKEVMINGVRHLFEDGEVTPVSSTEHAQHLQELVGSEGRTGNMYNRNGDENLYIETPDGVIKTKYDSVFLAETRANKQTQPEITTIPLTEGDKLAIAKDSFSDRSTIVEATDLKEVPESGIFSRVKGEAPVSHAVRLLNANQIGGVLDIHPLTEGFGDGRLEATKQLSAYKKALKVLEFINENRNESMSDQLELFGVGLDPKVTEKLPQLIKELNSVIKQVEEHTAEQVAKDWSPEVSSSMTKNQRVTFQEDLSYQRARLESGVEAKQIYQALDQAVEDGTFTKNYRDAIVKVLTTLGELPKEEVPELTNSKPTVKNQVRRRLAKIETSSNDRAIRQTTQRFKSVFTDKQQTKARAAYKKPYGSNKAKNGFIKNFSDRLAKNGVSIETRIEAVKLLSASLANLKVGPAQLLMWVDKIKTIDVDPYGYRGQATASVVPKIDIKLGKNYASELSVNQAPEVVKLALHELGHIYSYLFSSVEEQKLNDIYTKYVDVYTVRKYMLNENALFGNAYNLTKENRYSIANLSGSILSDSFAYDFKGVDEFFANMFQSTLYNETINALKTTPRNKPVSLWLIDSLVHFKNTWNSIKNIVSDDNLNGLTKGIFELIKKIDKQTYLTGEEALLRERVSAKIQFHLAQESSLVNLTDLPNFNGLLSYRNYNEQLGTRLLNLLYDPQSEKLLSSLVDMENHTSEQSRSLALDTIRGRIEKEINNLVGVVEGGEAHADPFTEIFRMSSGFEVDTNTVIWKQLAYMLDSDGSIRSILKQPTGFIISDNMESFPGSKTEPKTTINEYDLESRLVVASIFMPHRISEILQTWQRSAHDTNIIGMGLENNASNLNVMSNTAKIVVRYLDIRKSVDDYKATAFAYAVPDLFKDNKSNRAFYTEFSSIADFVNMLHSNENAEVNINTLQDRLMYLSREKHAPGDPIAGSYLQQFLFLDDILEHLNQEFGIRLKEKQNIFTPELDRGAREVINDLITSPFIPNNRKYEIIKLSVRGGKTKHGFNSFFEVAADLDRNDNLRSMVYGFLDKLNLDGVTFDTRLKEASLRLLDTNDIDKKVIETEDLFTLARLIANEILGPDKVEIVTQNIATRKKLLKAKPELVEKIKTKQQEVAVAKIKAASVKVKTEPISNNEVAELLADAASEPLTADETTMTTNNWKTNPKTTTTDVVSGEIGLSKAKNFSYLSDGPLLTVGDISLLVGTKGNILRKILFSALGKMRGSLSREGKEDMLSDLGLAIQYEPTTKKAYETILADGKDVKPRIVALSKKVLFNAIQTKVRNESILSSTGESQKKENSIIGPDGESMDFAQVVNNKRRTTERTLNEAMMALNQVGLTKDTIDKFETFSRLRLTPGSTEKSVAEIMGMTEDAMNKLVHRVREAFQKKQITIDILDGKITDINPQQLASRMARIELENATITELANPTEAAKKAIKPLRERMAIATRREATAEIFKDAVVDTVTEPSVAMPIVNKSKTKATMYATTLDGTTESVPSGTVLVAHEIATTIAETKQAEITTQVVVDITKPTIELVAGKGLVDTLKNTPESVFEEVGLEKEALIETLVAVNNPEEVLMNILKENEVPPATITITNKAKKIKSIIVLEPEAAKVTGVIDNTVESPTVRNVGTEPVKVDPSIVVDSTVKNAEKEVIIFDKVTGESPDLKPMIVTGTSDRVELSPIDKFDSEVMAGKEMLRLNGQDPKFIKYFLLKFNKLSSALVKNIGVKIEALPKEFENLLAEVQSYYLAINEHNRSNYTTIVFNRLNDIFWREFDKEVVSDLAARATPLSEMKPKKLGEIIKAASDRLQKAIDYNNSVSPVEEHWANFLPPISPDDFILSPLDAKESTFITEVRLRPKSEGERLFKATKQKRITAKTIVEDFKLTPLTEPVETAKPTEAAKPTEVAKPTEAAKPTEPVKEMDTVDTITESLADDLKKRMEDKKNSKDRNGFLRKWWINYSDNHTMHHTTLNWWSRIWRGSAKEITADANMVSRFMRLASGLIQTKSAEGKTIRSLNNVMRLMSSFVENGKLMSHQFVKAGTEAFRTFEASAAQNFREIIPLYDAQTKFNNAVGHMQMARDLQWNMIKAKAKTKGVLVDSELEQIILTHKPKATKEFIKTVIQRAKELQQVDINDNKLLIDLEVKTKWGRMVDRNGKQMDPNEYHSMTVDSNLVGTQNRTTILESMADVRSQTLLSEDTLDGNIMLGMGWLTEGTRKNRTIWSRDNRSGVRISDMADSPFDRTTLKMLEAKAKLDGENRYAPGTDLEKIWQLNDKNNHKYFSYIDPTTLEVVICSMPEIKAELSAGDLLKYNETVTGSLDYLSPFWLDRFKNKSVLEVTMEELLQYKTRTGRYSPHNTTSDTGKAVIGLFGSGNTYEGFAVRNLSIDEVLNSKVLKDIFRYEYFSTKKNFRQSRGFELLVQREIDRLFGVTGFRASEFFESGRQVALEGAGSNDKMVDHINGGFSRISDDYNSYAGNLPSINSKYNNVDQVVSNIGTNIVRVASAPKWAIRSLAEPLVLLTDELVGKNFGDSINGVFKIFKTYVLRDKKSFEKNAVNNLIFGIREVMNHQERFLSEADDILSSSLGRNRWVDRLLRTKENGTVIEKGFDLLGNFGVEAGGSRELSTAARGIAIVKFVREFALTIDKAKELLVLMEKPENRKIAAELNQLSRSKTSGSVKLSKHFKTLARDARFGGDWVTAAQYVRFNLLNKETLDAISFAFKDMGVQDGRVDMAKFREWTQAYTTNGIGPISKEAMHQAYHDFSYAIETRVTTDGMISESRGLNRDLSLASRTPLGRFMKSLLQWSASYQSNVLQNGGLMTPAGVILKALIVYNVYTYLTDLLVEYGRGRDPKDIIKEIQDPKTYVFRMASSTPVLGRYQSILTEGLATASLLTGGKFQSFGISTDVPAAAVANSWIRKMGKSVKALATDRNLSAGEVAGHIGNLAQVNNLINGSPIGVGASTMQQIGIIEQGDALDAYLRIARGNPSSLNKYGGVQPASNTNYDYSPSSETPYELKRRKTYEQMKQIEKLNKIMEKPKSLTPLMINIKGVSYDLAKKLNEMNQQ